MPPRQCFLSPLIVSNLFALNMQQCVVILWALTIIIESTGGEHDDDRVGPLDFDDWARVQWPAHSHMLMLLSLMKYFRLFTSSCHLAISLRTKRLIYELMVLSVLIWRIKRDKESNDVLKMVTNVKSGNDPMELSFR